MTIIVTGGAGFIGANFVHDWLGRSCEPLVNIDLLTYAGNLMSLETLEDDERHFFIKADIADRAVIRDALLRFRPRAILNFAAESHVDRSIDGPAEFLKTNVGGTFALLEECSRYWKELDAFETASFRFIQVSTDEVYGSLDADDPPFAETTPFSPNSPYAASKAAADHFARAWYHTYGFPVIITHCSNNYGPFQFPEKLIPLMICNALAGRNLPIYGDGLNVRDWLYVKDHVSALICVLERGLPGETYNIGGNNELRNVELVTQICALLDEFRPSGAGPYNRLIEYVSDRPGHDRRYAIDNSKITGELGWRPAETLGAGLEKTVKWYLENDRWTTSTLSGAYRAHSSDQDAEHSSSEGRNR